MHYQEAPHAEAKFVRCTRGAIYDVIVDLRPDSPTRGQWFGVELTADNGTMLYAPEGFAHGYQTLADDTEMYYMTTARYAAASAQGVRFDDPAFGIEWPLPVSVISDPDRSWPDFRAISPMKRVLLTGASGFIGHHCIAPLQGARLRRARRVEPGTFATDAARDVASAPTCSTVRRRPDWSGDIAPTHLLHLAWYVVPGKLISSPENFAWVTSSLELVRQFCDQGGNARCRMRLGLRVRLELRLLLASS